MARVTGLLGRSVPLPQWETVIEQLPHLLVASPEEVEVCTCALVSAHADERKDEGRQVDSTYIGALISKGCMHEPPALQRGCSAFMVFSENRNIFMMTFTTFNTQNW